MMISFFYFFKNHRLLGFYFLIIGALLLLVFLNFFVKNTGPGQTGTPLQPTITDENNRQAQQQGLASRATIIESPTVRLSDSTKITLAFPPITIPQESSIYFALGTTLKSADASLFAKDFGFTSQPTVLPNGDTQVLLWTDPGKTVSLDIDLGSGNIEYNNNYIPPKPDTNTRPLSLVTTNEQAISLAQKFLQGKRFISSDVFPFPDSITYFTNFTGELNVTDDINSVNMFAVHFGRRINSFPLYRQYGSPAYVTIFVDKFSTIRKVSLQYKKIIPSVNKKVQLLSLNEVKNALLNKQGVIVQPIPDTSQTPSSITLTNLQLVYFDDGKVNNITPLFYLTGKMTLSNGEEKDVIMYLPAVKSQ